MFTVVPASLGSWRVEEYPEYKVRQTSTVTPPRYAVGPCYAVDKKTATGWDEIDRTALWYVADGGSQEKSVLEALAIIVSDLKGEL